MAYIGTEATVVTQRRCSDTETQAEDCNQR